jgi:hypothetical protein
VLCLIPGGHDDAVDVKLELGKGGLMMRLEMEMREATGLDSTIYTSRRTHKQVCAAQPRVGCDPRMAIPRCGSAV